jgi:hypothetical protein
MAVNWSTDGAALVAGATLVAAESNEFLFATGGLIVDRGANLVLGAKHLVLYSIGSGC